MDNLKEFQMQETLTLLSERIAELELALEDQNWTRLSMQSSNEFSRAGLRKINQLANYYFLKNPLTQRGVTVQGHYVFGQGITIRAASEDVDEVIQKFWEDDKNKVELTSHQALLAKNQELILSGNLFFVFFVNPVTGRVRVRSIPTDEVEEILTNPEDRKDPWFYKRIWSTAVISDSGQSETIQQTVYYPDWRYMPDIKRPNIGEFPVMWDTPVFHVKVGGTDAMRFGVSEVYSSIDWTRAYKEFLEDWATLSRALSKIAYKVSTQGGKSGISAAKTKLASTLGSGAETNPAPASGSNFIAGTGADITAVSTNGARFSAEDGRRMMLMTAAAFGLPESFFGDVSVGTLATAKSLDRPTELKFSNRQELWKSILGSICRFVIYQAIKAGALQGTIIPEDDGTPVIELPTDPETGKPQDQTINILFPPILEHDTVATVTSIVQAATLSGGQPQTIDPINLTKLLMTALGEDPQPVLDALYPDGKIPEPTAPTQESAVIEAVTKLKEAAEKLLSDTE